MQDDPKQRILIFGASGFLGNAIYKELCSYFNTFGTYCTDNKEYEKNQHFIQYKVEEDDVDLDALMAGDGDDEDEEEVDVESVSIDQFLEE